ncbi:MAG: hypothetical protein IJX57_00475, partial [Clostridia bacterium]|nr:hypothetical protein [Clostridia bacterium]
MKNNRFISLILAIAMVLTSFTGLSAVSVAAEDIAPALSELDFTTSYTEMFEFETTTSSTVGAELKTENWTLSRDDVFTIRTGDKAVSMDYGSRWAQYNQAAQSGLFYYKYKIRLYDETAGNQVVKLVGGNGTYSVVAGPVSSATEYTTVVDADNDVAYTYDATGSVIATTPFTDDVITGVKFDNESATNGKGFYIYDFYYGVETAVETEPTATPALPQAPVLSDLVFTSSYTEMFEFETTTSSTVGAELKTENWTLSRDDVFTIRTGDKAVSMDYGSRWAQYNQAAQ